ncbi:hypothetical protein D2E65_09305 [Mycobacteroides abscessus]|nr:hypothetical protein D2E65_09305 [Mycobacteroides abscessus]
MVKSATCGSADSNYRIIKITQRPAGCPTDSDQKFNRWTKEAELTLCLDYDWSPSSCLSIGGATWYATRVPCDRPRSEQPQSVVLDSATVADCPTGGYAHPERRFTICTRLTP